MESQAQDTKKSRVVKWSLIVGIVIVMNMFFNYGLSLIFHSPEFNDFCKLEQVQPAVPDQKTCTDAGGQWTENPSYQTKPVQIGEIQPKGYCDTQFTCRQNFDAASKTYGKKVFISLVALGVLVIIAGAFVKGFDVLSLALSLGGVLSFVIASTRFWSSADEWIKVLILAIALVGLVWLAIKKFKD